MSPQLQSTDAPEDYTPSYCEAVHSAFLVKMNGVEEKVEKVDNRLWMLLLIAIGNLLAALGGAVGLLLR